MHVRERCVLCHFKAWELQDLLDLLKDLILENHFKRRNVYMLPSCVDQDSRIS